MRKFFPALWTYAFVMLTISFFSCCASHPDIAESETIPDTVAPAAAAAPNIVASSEPSTGTDSASSFKYTYVPETVTGEPVQFNEVWGYVVNGYTKSFENDFPVTDVAFFAASVNNYGHITETADRKAFAGFSGRVHLVTSCNSRALTHFILDPEYPLRDQLIAQLVELGQSYDGIQIDYELIPGQDRENFLTFLTLLKAALGTKILSVCVPARVRTIDDDMYPYKKLSEIADRIIVMAYDQHWSGSEPGAVASMSWCEKIADYAVSVIPSEKLVMGLPFYGRMWGDVSGNKDLSYSGVNTQIAKHDVAEIMREDSIPHFSYTVEMHVTGWFDDAYSLVERCRLYKNKKIENISFWRVGQEDPEFWKWIILKSPAN